MDRSKWEYKKLGEVCEKGSSNIAQNKVEDNTGDYALYGASGYVKSIDFYHQEQPYIGVVKDGSGVGRVNKYPAKSSLLGTMQYIYPKNGCDLGYLLYVLQGLHLEKYKTGAAIPHIYFKDYCKCEVPFPSLLDQQRIVAELDCLNEMIALKQEQLKEFDKLAQSIFYDMFGDPITNEKEWKMSLLKDATTNITDGDHMPPPKSERGVPFVTISNVNKETHQIDFSDTFFVPKEYYDAIPDNKKPQGGDVLYTVTGSYGIPILLKEKKEFCFQRHIGLIRPGSEIEPVFLCIWAECKPVKEYADRVATGVAQKTVSLKALRSFPIILPPLALQQQFAEKIQAIEAQKELVKKSIAETQHLLDSRMDFYFN